MQSEASIVQWLEFLPSKQEVRVRFPVDAVGGLAQSEERYVSNVQAPRSKLGFSILLRVTGAAIAQLGERQTEDLKVPGSIPGGGSMLMVPVAQRTRRETTNLKIAGSNPVGDKLIFLFVIVF